MQRLLPFLAAAALLFVACRRPFTPYPLPANFAVQRLSGEHLTAAQMRGSPWVVNFWLPT
ncbi:MAG: hypothetical protein ACLQDQ_02390 [Myxococcaceae bacterium]